MKGFILASLLIVAVSASLSEELGSQFQAFKLKHGKTYKNQAEETKRFNIFKDNVRSIEEHNALYEQGLSSYKKGINQFADMTLEEFKAGLKLSAANKPVFNTTKYVMSGRAIPSSVDWRQDGQVTEVKNQNACGSCWSFSVTGSTEAAYKRKSGTLVSLSEQQLVDCTRDVNAGCDGGLILQTFPYVQQYGLESEADYPYLAVDQTCQYNANKVVAKATSYVGLPSGDENALLDAVGNVGPVSVAIDASYIGLYSSGIFEDTQCSNLSPDLNHGVLTVGYGTENGEDYWIVKNSWSANYGEQGYLRMKRGINQCGIAQDTSYPLIA